MDRNRINQYFRIEKWDTIVENIMISLEEAFDLGNVDNTVLRLKLMYVNLPTHIQEELKEQYDGVQSHIKHMVEVKKEADTDILNISKEFYELCNDIACEHEYGFASKPIPPPGRSQLAPEPDLNEPDESLGVRLDDDNYQNEDSF